MSAFILAPPTLLVAGAQVVDGDVFTRMGTSAQLVTA